MASLLDTLLSRNTQRRNQQRQDALDSLMNSQVTAMTPRGIQLSVPDSRQSTQLARQAVQATTGLQGPINRSGVDTVIPFANGINTFETLERNNIGVGSTLGELSGFLERFEANPNLAAQDNRPNATVSVPTPRPTNISTSQENDIVQQSIPRVTDTGQQGNTRSVTPSMPQRQGGGQTSDDDFLQIRQQITRAQRNFQELLQGVIFE